MSALPLAYRQIHLDFHTSPLITGVGSRWDPERFVRTLQDARVNSVTCFSRCHHGMIYHDTKFVEARHPHLEVNLLKEQVEACHAAGIRVPIYISVGWDEFQAAQHPEWIEVAPDGKRRGAPLEPGWKKLCLNSPYIDYVSEQTQEVLSMFETDGIFFDILHQWECCCPRCLEGMQAQGLNPEVSADRWTFSRRVLERVRERLAREVRAVNEDCLLFWNSGHIDPTVRPVLHAYTHLELESLPSGGWGYDHFPLTVRYARNLGLDFLGMTGKFQKTWAGFGEYKNPPALEYECFTALAEGGKCSIGDQLHPSGELTPATYELIGAVYRSVEEKEPWCADARPVTEIAIFNPEAVWAADGRVDTAATGALHMLLEAHHQCDIVDAEMDWSGYRVLVLPDKIRLTPELAERLRGYLANGGAVIASHQSGMAADREEFLLQALGVRYLAPARHSPDFLVAGEALSKGIPKGEHVMYDRGCEVEVIPGAEVLAEVWHPYFDRTWDHFSSHRHSPVNGPGGFPAAVATTNTAYFAHPVFSSYLRHGPRVYKQLFLNVLRRFLPEPLVRTNAPTTARITLTHQAREGRLVAHVLHYVPEQRFREIQTIEDTIPLFNVKLDLRLDEEPRAVYMAPGGVDLPFDYEGGRLQVNVPEVVGHQMVVFEGVACPPAGR